MNQEPIIFDAQFALQQFSGNQPLLLKMLQKFTEQYAGIEQQLRAFLDASDLDSVKQQIHTIKGVSGNLGMNALHQASREFERDIKEQAEQASANHYLRVVKQTFAAVDEYVAANQPETPAQTTGRPASFCSQTKQDLLALLKRNEFITGDKLDNLIGGCALEQRQQVTLRRAIDDLDYATAISLLE